MAKPHKPSSGDKAELAKRRKAQEARQEFVSFTSTVGAVSIVVGIVLFAVGGIKAAVGAVAILAIALSYKYPRQALWFFLIYLPINGTITYTIGGGSPLFQLAKDAFYIPALIAMVQDCRKKNLPIFIPTSIIPSVVILLILSLITLVTVNGYNQFTRGGWPFFQGILGLKVLMGYIPLVFCGYYLIRNKAELLFSTRLHTVLAIACCILGLVQYYLLYTGRCQGTRGMEGDALFKATIEARCFVGGSLVYSPGYMIRLPGTFVSPWHWAWFLIPNGALTFATAFCDSSLWWRLTGIAAMALVFVNAVVCGQRIAMILVPVVIGILLILTGQVTNLKRFLPIGVLLGIILALVASQYPDLIAERIASLIDRWEAAPPEEFILGQIYWAMDKADNIFGMGLGRATNSTRIFGETVLVETYWPKLLYEGGWPGLIGFFGVATSLVVVGFFAYRRVSDKSLRDFGSSFWVFLLIISYFPYWYPLDTDPVCVYYWFFAGVLFKLYYIEQEEQKTLDPPESMLSVGGKVKSGVRRIKQPSTPLPDPPVPPTPKPRRRTRFYGV